VICPLLVSFASAMGVLTIFLFLTKDLKNPIFQTFPRGQGRPRDDPCTGKSMTMNEKSRWTAKHYRADRSAQRIDQRFLL